LDRRTLPRFLNAEGLAVELDEFVGHCRVILRERGQDAFVSAVGYICLPGRRYLDDLIKINEAEHQGRKLFEVTVRYQGDGGEINNPAIMIDGENVIRRHGDWCRAADHVERLVDEITNVCPICHGQDGNHFVGCP
jgi:hypothetical protein